MQQTVVHHVLSLTSPYRSIKGIYNGLCFHPVFFFYFMYCVTDNLKFVLGGTSYIWILNELWICFKCSMILMLYLGWSEGFKLAFYCYQQNYNCYKLSLKLLYSFKVFKYITQIKLICYFFLVTHTFVYVP